MFAAHSLGQGGRVPVLSILALIIQRKSSEASHTSWAEQREEKQAGTAEEDTELA